MIRKAQIGDEKEIFKLLSETLTPWSEENIISSINRDMVLLFVQKDIRGVIIFSKVLDECELLNFAVEEKSRGAGIGRKLLKNALSDEFTRNTHVFLEVRKGNSAAISLYEKCGFEKTGERKKYYTNPSEDAVLMKFDNF